MNSRSRQPRLFADWRDLAREYLIVVLGVLTALLAQTAIEEWNWRHKVASAIQDMDQELITGNGPQAFVRLSIHECLANRLDTLRAVVERGDREVANDSIGAIQLPLRNYNNQAREAANSADITAHMPPDRKYDYRIVYALTPEMDAVHRKELEDLAILRSLPATGGQIGPDERRALFSAIENLSIDNDRMKRAARFTLIRMRNMGLGLDRPQVERNLLDLPAYRGCLRRNIGPMLMFAPMSAGGRRV